MGPTILHIHRGMVLAALVLAGTAAAEPRTLRFATIAPDGTLWARQARAFGQEVETATVGQVRVKWYFGGATGDDRQTRQYIQEGKLDGMASGACGAMSPALFVTNVVGLFRNRDEATYVLRKIRSTVNEEMRASGFVDLGLASFGMAVLFSRTPVRSLADLQRDTYWYWDVHQVGVAHLRAMGVHVRPLPVTAVARAYDSGQIDGFIVSPTAALAFQWSTQARYFNDLQLGFAPTCLVISSTAMDQLTLDQQRVLRMAGERLAQVFDRTGKLQDEELMHRLFERQGLQRVPVDAAFRNEFFETARLTRPALDPKSLPPAAFRQVLDLLADYRAEQRAEGESQ